MTKKSKPSEGGKEFVDTLKSLCDGGNTIFDTITEMRMIVACLGILSLNISWPKEVLDYARETGLLGETEGK